MANPRDAIEWEDAVYETAVLEIDGVTIVFDDTLAGGSAVVGRAVTISAARTVALADTDDSIFGKLLLVEGDNKATIITRGKVKLPGGAAAVLTVGFPIVGDQGAAAALGFIQAVAVPTGATPTAPQMEAALKARGQIVDAAVTTAVWVYL